MNSRWRLLLAENGSGVANMARDSGLMDRARETGESVFSVYGWARPTMSLGRNQTARRRYDLDEIAAREIDVVRRPTGGRALLHYREVTYSVTAPIFPGEPLAASYRRINSILLTSLRSLGVDAEESRTDARTPEPGSMPCFALPAEGELVAGGAKLVGSAQVRENGALLQHGSILVEDDQPLIASLLINGEQPHEVPPAATLAGALGRIPAVAEVAAHLFDAVRLLEDEHASLIHLTDVETYTARHVDRYESEWWTWRR